jgi:hypothetical protein
MRLVYCSNPVAKAEADPAYTTEFDAAMSQGFDCSLINFEALLEGNPQRAVARVIKEEKESSAIFRGWMMKPAIYSKLYEALLCRGLRLINSPAEYRHCHYLPESFDLIRERSPRSIWIKISDHLDMKTVHSALREFGSSALVVKDYVKSRKHEWAEAFFIPAADNREAVQNVVTNFVQRQGEDLNEGLVFREFIEFEPIGSHPKSGLPLSNESRCFFLEGLLLDTAEYWEIGNYAGERPPLEQFNVIAKRIHSHFFTMDIAKTKSGEWLIVELGDGQVAGLPDKLDVHSFYEKLFKQLQPF